MHTFTLLILGSKTEFTPLVRLAKERGFRTVVADGNTGTEAKALADRAYDVDIRDAAAVAEIAKKEGADAITTAYSDLLFECAVRIADAAGLPYHLTPDLLPYYRDKSVMKKTMDALGIKNAKSALLTGEDDAAAISSLRFPIVIKPLDLYGSRGLRVAGSPEEAFACARDIRAAFPQETALLAEEYNTGREYNIQCFVHRGEVHVLGICDREKTAFLEGQIPFSTRNVYPARRTEEILPEAKEILSAYVKRTGQTSGPLSMQFFYEPGEGVSVCEIAARFLGYEHDLLERTCCISIEELLLAAAKEDEEELQRILAAVRPQGVAAAAVLYFHARDGIVADESAARSVAQHPAVTLSELFYSEGDRVGDPQSMPYFARFSIAAPTREEADSLSLQLIAAMSAKDKNGDELVYQNRIASA